MSAKKQTIVVAFGNQEHPRGGLRFGSQPRDDEREQQEQRPKGDEAETEATLATG